MSSEVSRICPTVMRWTANARAYARTRRLWPTLAAACWVARSRGRLTRPSGPSPAAIAPDETITQWAPRLTRSATAAASAAMFSSRRPLAEPPGWSSAAAEPALAAGYEVTDEEPILTTMVCAAVTSGRVPLTRPPRHRPPNRRPHHRPSAPLRAERRREAADQCHAAR